MNGVSGMAIASLVLGVVSFFGGSLLTAIPGAILGKVELDKIQAGQSSAEGKTVATLGFWVSVVNIVLWTLGICGGCLAWLFMFGGLTILGLAGAAAG